MRANDSSSGYGRARVMREGGGKVSAAGKRQRDRQMKGTDTAYNFILPAVTQAPKKDLKLK